MFNKQFQASFLQDVTRNSLFKLLLILNWCWRNFESCVEWFPGFSSLYFKISPKNSGHLLKKLDSKLKPITPWSRAPISFFAFTLSSVWLLVVYFFNFLWLAVMIPLIWFWWHSMEMLFLLSQHNFPDKFEFYYHQFTDGVSVSRRKVTCLSILRIEGLK